MKFTGKRLENTILNPPGAGEGKARKNEKIMKTLDFRRAKSILKWNYLYQKSSYMKTLLGWCILFFAIMMFFGHIVGESEPSGAMIGCMLSMLVVVGVISPSWTFHYMKTNQNRIDYLMLPGSNVEKMAVGYLFCTVGYLVMFVLAFFVSDLAQYAFTCIWKPSEAVLVMTVVPWRDIFCTEGEGLVGLLALLWAHTVYLVGGTFFRRNAWLLTSIACFIAALAIGMVVTWVVNLMARGGYVVTIDTSCIGLFYTIVSIVLCLASAFNYWLAYKLFCRMQVINNKWINI